MARAARKEVNIRIRTRIQASTLFVGTTVRRKATCAQNGPIQRISLALVEKTKDAEENHKTAQAKQHSRSQLLRALQTRRRLKLLSDHRTLITKVG